MLMRRILCTVVAVASVAGACSNSDSVRGAPVTVHLSTHLDDGRCEALAGSEPWLVLHTQDYDAECVSVGVHQDLQIWNKGTEGLSLEWPGALGVIPSDYYYATGPVGESFDPGVYAIESNPYRSPDIHVVDPGDSFSARTELGVSGFGPVKIGMTVEEASAASGETLRVDPNLAPGPECWHAVIEGDPYSPVFTVAGDGNDAGIIEFITTFYPPDEAATVGSARASVPSLCG